MTNWVLSHYDLWRGLHILAVIAWMAGLLYLPRLYAYHTRTAPGSEMDATFTTMEAKLLSFIMRPASIAALAFGVILIFVDGTVRGWSFLTQPWMLLKLAGVVFLFGWHGFLIAAGKRFAAGANTRSERFWRMTNELPFLAAIVMVIAVTTEWPHR